MPVCAHQATRQKAFAWVPDISSQSPDEQSPLDEIAELLVQMRAKATEDKQRQYEHMRRAWQGRRNREERRDQARFTTSSPINENPPEPSVRNTESDASPDTFVLVGTDEAAEVPPMDNRPWCTPCLLVKAFNHDEKDRIRTKALDGGTSVQEWMNGGNPLSYDDQHLSMAPDGFNASPADHQHIYQGPLDGPYTYSFDALTSSRWDLFTHAAFHTWPHHDGSGMSTWLTVRSGCKVWAPLIPNLPDKAFLSQHDLFESMHDVLKPPPSTDFMRHSQSLCMFLLPHDVL